MRSSGQVTCTLFSTLALSLVICGEASGLETKIEGFEASETPQFILSSKAHLTSIPGVFEITNSIQTSLREDSIKGVRVYAFDAEWISAGLKGPLCPEKGRQQPQQSKIERSCNPLEGRIKALVSFFSVDPGDFGIGYGYKVEPELFKKQVVGKIPGLSGRAPAYMPIHRVIGVIPAGIMPKCFSNPGHAPEQRLEIITQLSIGGFKTPTVTGDISKDNAVFQARSVVVRSKTGLYTYRYEIAADYKRGVAFNWTSARTPKFPSGWKGRLPKEPVLQEELKDRSEAPLLLNDPAFVSFGDSPKHVEEVSALGIPRFPIPPPLNKEVPLKAKDFRKGLDNATGEMRVAETTISAIFSIPSVCE